MKTILEILSILCMFLSVYIYTADNGRIDEAILFLVWSLYFRYSLDKYK